MDTLERVNIFNQRFDYLAASPGMMLVKVDLIYIYIYIHIYKSKYKIVGVLPIRIVFRTFRALALHQREKKKFIFRFRFYSAYACRQCDNEHLMLLYLYCCTVRQRKDISHSCYSCLSEVLKFLVCILTCIV